MIQHPKTNCCQILFNIIRHNFRELLENTFSRHTALHLFLSFFLVIFRLVFDVDLDLGLAKEKAVLLGSPHQIS